MKILNFSKKNDNTPEVKKVLNHKPMIEPFVDVSIDETGELFSTNSLFGTNYTFLFNDTDKPNYNELDYNEVVARRLALSKMWQSRIRYFYGICVQNLIGSIYYKASEIENKMICTGFTGDIYDELFNSIGELTNDIYYKVDEFVERYNAITKPKADYSYEPFGNLFSYGFSASGNTESDIALMRYTADSITLDLYSQMFNNNFYKMFIKYGICPTEYSMFDKAFCGFRDSLCTMFALLTEEKKNIIYPLSCPNVVIDIENMNGNYLNWRVDDGSVTHPTFVGDGIVF